MRSNLAFRLMGLVFCVRDWLRPPEGILREAGVRPGMTVLDFGCGPGGFSVAAARMVGGSGTVYALDMHPLAVKCVENAASNQGLANIQAAHADNIRGLPNGSMDLVLCYDVLHELRDPSRILSEIARILKPKGILSVSDHHLKERELVATMEIAEQFRLYSRTQRTFEFRKSTPNARESEKEIESESMDAAH
jgi:ubiquinone/menaquinone biosynthesis C-methylase UbiE